jgi:uncharacterized protein (TIGR02246 family)
MQQHRAAPSARSSQAPDRTRRTGGSETTAEAEILKVVDSWIAAVRAQDVGRIVSHYAPDIVAFDAVSQLRFRGVHAYREHWEKCLALCPGPMVFEIHDVSIVAGDDVAFCHCLNRCGAAMENGEEKTSWMRGTIGYRKTNGNWQVVHEHWSAPFDIESGKALFDLQP